MTSNPRTFIDQIVGPRIVHATKSSNIVHLTGGAVLSRFDEQMKIALMSHLRGLYSKTYLHLDPMDEDILNETAGHWELAGPHLYFIPTELDLSLLHQELYRGNWLLLFRNQAISGDFRIPDGYGNPAIMQQLLLGTDEQFAIASGPDDS